MGTEVGNYAIKWCQNHDKVNLWVSSSYELDRQHRG